MTKITRYMGRSPRFAGSAVSRRMDA